MYNLSDIVDTCNGVTTYAAQVIIYHTYRCSALLGVPPINYLHVETYSLVTCSWSILRLELGNYPAAAASAGSSDFHLHLILSFNFIKAKHKNSNINVKSLPI